MLVGFKLRQTHLDSVLNILYFGTNLLVCFPEVRIYLELVLAAGSYQIGFGHGFLIGFRFGGLVNLCNHARGAGTFPFRLLLRFLALLPRPAAKFSPLAQFLAPVSSQGCACTSATSLGYTHGFLCHSITINPSSAFVNKVPEGKNA